MASVTADASLGGSLGASSEHKLPACNASGTTPTMQSTTAPAPAKVVKLYQPGKNIKRKRRQPSQLSLELQLAIALRQVRQQEEQIRDLQLQNVQQQLATALEHQRYLEHSIDNSKLMASTVDQAAAIKQLKEQLQCRL